MFCQSGQLKKTTRHNAYKSIIRPHCKYVVLLIGFGSVVDGFGYVVLSYLLRIGQIRDRAGVWCAVYYVIRALISRSLSLWKKAFTVFQSSGSSM